MFLIAYIRIDSFKSGKKEGSNYQFYDDVTYIFFTLFRVVNIFNLSFIWTNQLKTEFRMYLHFVCQY